MNIIKTHRFTQEFKGMGAIIINHVDNSNQVFFKAWYMNTLTEDI